LNNWPLIQTWKGWWHFGRCRCIPTLWLVVDCRGMTCGLIRYLWSQSNYHFQSCWAWEPLLRTIGVAPLVFLLSYGQRESFCFCFFDCLDIFFKLRVCVFLFYLLRYVLFLFNVESLFFVSDCLRSVSFLIALDLFHFWESQGYP
jgi:hypothetical protein